MNRDDLIEFLNSRVETAAKKIAESRERRAKETSAHEEWRVAMRKQKENMETRRLARADVHGVKLGYFEKGKFHPHDPEPKGEAR